MRILGVDHGERRMGLAISDALELTARPLDVVTVKSVEQALEAVRLAAAAQEAEKIVVGLPLNMDGSEGPQAKTARAFVERLRGVVALPIDMSDERLTSVGAEDAMLAADLSRAQRKKRRDAVAAQMILQTYLDRQRASG